MEGSVQSANHHFLHRVGPFRLAAVNHHQGPSCREQILALIDGLEAKGQFEFTQAEIIEALNSQRSKCTKRVIQNAIHYMTAGKAAGQPRSTEDLEEVSPRVYRRARG